MRKTVILQVLPTLFRGGTEAFVMNNYRFIDREKYQFIFLIIDGGNAYDDEILSLGGEVIHSGLCFSKAAKLIPSFISLVKLLKSLEFDAIHSHINQFNGVVFLAARLAGKHRFVSHSHNTNFSDRKGSFLRKLVYEKLIFSLTRKLSDIRLACGELAGRALYDKYPYTVLTNAVDVYWWNDISSQEIKQFAQSLGIPESTRTYSSISRFHSSKNLTFAVDIFNHIHKKDSNSFLLIGGVGDDTKEEVEDRIKKYGLENNTLVMGQCNRMREIYHISDCWILPSLFEGLPFSLIEAQACGLHSIVSSVIDPNVDLGLELLHFCNLDDDPKVWAEAALNCQSHALPLNEIMDKMDMKGYLLSTNIKHLESIYKEVLCLR